MKSYSITTTIALLSTLLGSTLAVPSTGAASSTKRELFDTLDFVTMPEGGLGALFAGKQRSGLIVADTNTQDIGALGNASPSTGTLRDSLRGKGDGKGGVFAKKEKSIGKVGIGKDCKRKSEKSHKSKVGKSKGKGPKSSKSGEPTYAPTTSPSEAPTISTVPSEAPSESMSPTWAWCLEEEFPSSSPDSTMAPTTQNQPRFTDEPTVTFRPTVTYRPTVTFRPTLNPTTMQGNARSICMLLHAEYEGNEISIWNPSIEDNGTKEGTAAITTTVASPVDTSSTKAYDVSVTFQIVNTALDSSDIESKLDEAVSEPVALEIVQCAATARSAAMRYYIENAENDTENADRRLIDEKDSTLAVIRNWSCGNKNNCFGERCFITCSTFLNYVGSAEFGTLKSRIIAAFEEYFSIVDDVTEWYPQQKVTADDISIEENTSNQIDGIIDTKNSQRSQGMKAGPFIGAATGMLAMLLLLVLFVRRRKRNEEESVSHLKLDDSADNDTYYNGSDASGLQNEYNTRDIHIVGEGDSVISHWTGYTGRPKPSHDNYEVPYPKDGLMRGRSRDVHQCSSATCDICDEQRQTGVNFIKTGTSSLPARTHSLPSDASRDYIANDTVQL